MGCSKITFAIKIQTDDWIRGATASAFTSSDPKSFGSLLLRAPPHGYTSHRHTLPPHQIQSTKRARIDSVRARGLCLVPVFFLVCCFLVLFPFLLVCQPRVASSCCFSVCQPCWDPWGTGVAGSVGAGRIGGRSPAGESEWRARSVASSNRSQPSCNEPDRSSAAEETWVGGGGGTGVRGAAALQNSLLHFVRGQVVARRRSGCT